MVLAQAVELDVVDAHHLIVAIGFEDSEVEWLRCQQLLVGSPNPTGSVD